jgi:hypothetical protein
MSEWIRRLLLLKISTLWLVPRSHMMGVGAQVPGFARCVCWSLPRSQTLLARGSASHGDPIRVMTVRSLFISFRRKVLDLTHF